MDGALDAMSGRTSQPNLGSIVAALEGSPRDTQIDPGAMRSLSHDWEGVRRCYAPFESEIRCGTSDVYRHEMPGGQYTNLREQARSMGLEHRWPDIAEAYAQVNLLFGDIVKVTPTSKVVGDMALFMVANDLTPEDITKPDKELSFPEALQKKVLKGQVPLSGRPGEHLPSADLQAEREKAQKLVGHAISDQDLASYLMYPKVFQAYAKHRSQYGDVSGIPTPAYFYGLQDHEKIAVEIEPGKTLIVKIEGRTPADDEGQCRLFFELNGQPRLIQVPKAGAVATTKALKTAEEGNPSHIASPMPGTVTRVAVKAGQRVGRGDVLLSIEAMKMESLVCAEHEGTVTHIHVKHGDTVPAKALEVEMAS